MNIRAVTGEDQEAIWSMYDKHFKGAVERSSKVLLQHMDLEAALQGLLDHPGAVIVEDTYFLVTQESSLYVEDLILVKLYQGPGTLNDVIAFMKSEATVFGKSGIMIGTGLTFDDSLADKLQGLGFTEADRTFFLPLKE